MKQIAWLWKRRISPGSSETILEVSEVMSAQIIYKQSNALGLQEDGEINAARINVGII